MYASCRLLLSMKLLPLQLGVVASLFVEHYFALDFATNLQSAFFCDGRLLSCFVVYVMVLIPQALAYQHWLLRGVQLQLKSCFDLVISYIGR